MFTNTSFILVGCVALHAVSAPEIWGSCGLNMGTGLTQLLDWYEVPSYPPAVVNRIQYPFIPSSSSHLCWKRNLPVSGSGMYIANYDDQIHHERKSVMFLHNVVQRRRCHCIAVTEWWWMCHVLSQTALISLHRKVGSSDLKLGKLKFVLSDSVQNNHLPFVVSSCCPQWHLSQFFRREIKCY